MAPTMCSSAPLQSRQLIRLLLISLLWGVCSGLWAQVGASFDALQTTTGSFLAVKILSLSPSAITIRHTGGIAQIPLKSLPPELQVKLGYDPAKEAEHERQVAEQVQTQAAEAQKRQQTQNEAWRQRAATRGGSDSAIGRAMARFGTPATIQRIDLRPQFRELELTTKNQGYRPSCAVYAIVGALEFENAKAIGKPEKLSEEYLIWATRRSLGLQQGQTRKEAMMDGEDSFGYDIGFALPEVLSAIRAYGIPASTEMPNMLGRAMAQVPEPPPEVIASARTRRQVTTEMVPGVNNDVRLQNIMHMLNEGVPVVIGLRWPFPRATQHNPTLSTQAVIPNAAHAVTLVGYYTDSGNVDDIRFIFRNSWGMNWGVGGYGFATFGYLRTHLLEAVIVEVRTKGP